MQTPGEVIEALKNTYMTAQQISSMEKSFNNLSQGDSSFSEYTLAWTDALTTLLETDKHSGYQNNEEKQVLHFIQGVSDQTRREALQ